MVDKTDFGWEDQDFGFGNVQFEMPMRYTVISSRQLNTEVWSSEEKSGLKVHI